jgi:hypothetical protein
VRRPLRATIALAATSGLLFTGGGGSAAAGPGMPTFRTFELSSTPPHAAGVVCPGSSDCWNFAAEPAIRAAKDGTIYASSENGLSAGTEAWRSTDGGLHYASLLSPNDVSTAGDSIGEDTGFEPGGGDTDLAIAPVKNGDGIHNVYVASLTGAEVDVSTSRDGGATWTLNAAAGLPLDDREWIAADSAQKVCISYTTAAGVLLDPAGLHVDCSSDGGATFLQRSDAIDDNTTAARLGFKAGNMAIDPATHVIYQTFVSQFLDDATNPKPTDYHVVYMAVSTDGGKTFADHVVYANPKANVGYAHQFPNVSVDRAGNVYSVFSDDHNVYLAYSTDHGRTWSTPMRVNARPANTAIFPWSVAGRNGRVDVVYYGSSHFDGGGPDGYPASASWYAYMSQNLSVTSGGVFRQVPATPIVHHGGVCEGGVGCTGNRDLYDDFGVTASPLTGMASIVYSDDQFTSDPRDPAQPGCTAATTNTGACDHTAVATQVGGRGIY